MKIFVHSGTHWDREWYQTFQGFRFRLVNMMNDLMDGLENTPDYGVFHLDGQTIVLEDFLEIEPHQKDRLTGLIQAGKIVIGPWYCMPDEFLCSGESLIKNLRLGMKISGSYGVSPCKNGYICDIFGHSAQTPQIFASMGLHHSILGRGTNEHTTPRFFRWTAPDGSDVRVFRLEDTNGYGDYNNPVNGPQDDESVKERFRAYIEQRAATSNLPIVLMMDAIDHTHMRRETGRQLGLIRELFPDAEVYHVNVEEVGKAVDEYLDTLPRVYGELIEPAKVPAGYVHLITNTLSSRYPLKQRNDFLQTKLEKWIAPAYALGLTHASKGYLDLANKYLIQNHPHDSICGCSIDQVHRDMMYRFDQAEQICGEITKTVHAALSGDLSGWQTAGTFAPTPQEDDLVLRIYNPLPYDREETVTAEIVFPKSFCKYQEPFGYEKICSFHLYDAAGNPVPYGIQNIVTAGSDVYTVSFRTKLAAGTVTELLVRRSDTPSRYVQRLTTGLRSAENEHIALTVETDGTLSLTDKKTGVSYHGLLSLLDDGEIGDGWYHCNPAIDKCIVSTAADVEICENNAMQVTYRITQHLNLPVSSTEGSWKEKDWGIRRSSEYVRQDVVHFVTLARGERNLRIRTVVDNKVMDHRLRLRLPTGIKGKEYFASQAFCLVKRATDDNPETADWKEYGCVEKNTSGIVAKYSENSGFAFVSRYGLHECGVWADGTVDITLFRAFCKTVGTPGEPEGELLQKMEFEYLLCPLDADTPLSALAREQEKLAAGLASCTVRGTEAHTYRSLLRVDGDSFVYSTAFPLEDGVEIRLWNCSDRESECVLTVPDGFHSAALMELNGRITDSLPLADHSISIRAGKWKIVTVKLMKA